MLVANTNWKNVRNVQHLSIEQKIPTVASPLKAGRDLDLDCPSGASGVPERPLSLHEIMKSDPYHPISPHADCGPRFVNNDQQNVSETGQRCWRIEFKSKLQHNAIEGVS